MFLLYFLIFSLQYAQAQLCNKWSLPVISGQFSPVHFKEISGLSYSKKYNYFYAINDSGNGPYLNISKANGEYIKSIEILNTQFTDAEALSLGPCAGETCIFIGDIGDNLELRPEIKIVILKEIDFKSSAQPIKTLSFSYPEGPQNAEGMAVHPNGDIFIITKNHSTVIKKSYPAKLYKISYNDWSKTSTPKPELMGEIDIPKIMKDPDFYNQVVTSFDISPDGKRFIFLGYKNAIEFNVDLANLKERGKLTDLLEYRLVPLVQLKQQEALTYLKDSNSFVYTTEFRKKRSQDIMRVDCP